MAAISAAIIAGVGAMTAYAASQQEARAGEMSGLLNSLEAERNAKLAKERALEDERQFRLSFRRDQGSNVAAIGASGVQMEGSPLEVLRDSAAMAEGDAIKIRKGGQLEERSFLRQAAMHRMGMAETKKAGQLAGASAILSGASSVYGAGSKAGAF